MCFLCYSAGCCATTPSAVAYGMFSVSAALQRADMQIQLGLQKLKTPFQVS